MSCLNKILIAREDRRTGDMSTHFVRCRHCEDCKQTFRNQTFIRLKYEYDKCMHAGGMAFFFTLTFADEYVPFKFHRMCFDKRLVQKWLADFRQEFRRYYGFAVKYFLVSELGHVGTRRPHHHGILFLYPDTKYQLKAWQPGGKKHKFIPMFPATFCKKIGDTWKYGRCDIAEYDNNRGGMRYVSKYIAKDVAEENLFLDILTRIKMKRGHANYRPDFSGSRFLSDYVRYNPKQHCIIEKEVETAEDYLFKTYPALRAFQDRYCAFVMSSKGLGDSAPITDDMIIQADTLAIEGFKYSVPRYYVDRYIRRKQNENVPEWSADLSCSPSELVDTDPAITPCSSVVVEDNGDRKKAIPNRLYDVFCVPGVRVLNKCCELYFDNLFQVNPEKYLYRGVPYYKYRFTLDGSVRKVKALPLQSEVNDLPFLQAKYREAHILEDLEDRYYALPPLLQDSCEFDVPALVADTAKYLADVKDDSVYLCPTVFYSEIRAHLDDLHSEFSKWRAQSRIDTMAQKRREKERMNKRNAKAPLTWDEYKKKSRYFDISFRDFKK